MRGKKKKSIIPLSRQQKQQQISNPKKNSKGPWKEKIKIKRSFFFLAVHVTDAYGYADSQ